MRLTAILGAALVAACGGGGQDSAGQAGAGTASAQHAAQSCPDQGCGPLRLKIDGRQIKGPDGKALRLRGFNVEGLKPPVSPHEPGDADIIADQYHMNLLRLRISFTPETRDPDPNSSTGGFKPDYAADIARWVELARRRGLWMVVEMRVNDKVARSPDFYDTRKTGPCTDQGADTCPNFYYYQKAWTFLADKLRTVDYIAGYGLLAEPSADKAYGSRDEARHRLTDFQLALMRAISAKDAVTPFFVGPNYNYDTLEYDVQDANSPNNEYFTKLQDFRGRLVYEVNYLVPKDWIQSGNWPAPLQSGNPADKPEYPYPRPHDGYRSLLDGGLDGEPPERTFNRNLEASRTNYEKALSPPMGAWYLQWPIGFRDKFDVPVYVDQFGASSNAKGQVGYEHDLLCIFEATGLHWTRWSYNAGRDPTRTLQPDEPLNAPIIGFYSNLKPTDLQGCPAP
jgi:hypothetical protein